MRRQLSLSTCHAYLAAASFRRVAVKVFNRGLGEVSAAWLKGKRVVAKDEKEVDDKASRVSQPVRIEISDPGPHQHAEIRAEKTERQRAKNNSEYENVTHPA